MALGAVTLVKKGVIGPGGLRYVILNIVGPASYTADGEGLPIANFPKFQAAPLFSVVTPNNEASAATYAHYDNATQKLVFHDAATGVEEAAAQNLSSFSYRMFALGA